LLTYGYAPLTLRGIEQGRGVQQVLTGSTFVGGATECDRCHQQHRKRGVGSVGVLVKSNAQREAF
jgi:hypothetical protein